jgi:hypothetical protein
MVLMGWIASFGPTAASAQTVLIYYDGGGVLQERIDMIKEYDRNGTRVEIRGNCKSACTLFLGLRNVCVAPDALISFHGPMYQDRKKMSDEKFEHYSTIIADFYPKGIDSWFMKTARYVIGGKNFLTIKGSEMFKYGVRECPTIVADGS